MPVASAAVSPPLEAPGVRALSDGSRSRPQFAVGVPSNREVGKVGTGRLGSPQQPRIRSTMGASRPGYEPARAFSPCAVDVPPRSMFSLTVNGTPWNGGRSALNERTVSCLGGFQSLFAQEDRDGVDDGVHRLDPPEVSLDHFSTGGSPGPDRFGQVRGAHIPQVGGRDAHVYLPLRACYLDERPSQCSPPQAHQPRRWSTSEGSCWPVPLERQQSEICVHCRRADPDFAAEHDAAVDIPNGERSIRNTYGSLSSSGWSGMPR
jgi:hypothetical protein